MNDISPEKVAANLRRQSEQAEALGECYTPSDAWRLEAFGVLTRVARVGLSAADVIEALVQARVDAAAAVALVVERAAEAANCGCKADKSDCLFMAGDVTFCYREGLPDIRALADTDALAELAKLRGERVSFAQLATERLHVIADYAASLAAQTALVETLTGALGGLLAAYAEPDMQICCNGHECGCRGSTVQQMAEHYAREALEAATLAAMTPEERALCERSLAVRAGWKKVAEGQG